MSVAKGTIRSQNKGFAFRVILVTQTLLKLQERN
jgi:hypothetical protein